MARIREQQPLVPSVLDRLLDFEPELNREAPKSRTQVLRELRQSVRRDLENFLNTRGRTIPPPDDLEELKVSVVSYGLPDFTGASMVSQPNRQAFRRMVEERIQAFEPRFQSVHVDLMENADPGDRTLRFRIRGLLHAEPAPEPVSFDSVVEATTGTVEISDDES